jgi:zinc protease
MSSKTTPSRQSKIQSRALLYAICFALGLSPSFAGFAANNAPKPTPLKLDIAFQEFTLANGLRVIVHEDRKAPIVSVNLWYHVGSRNEPKGRTGFAHLYEHLMFQGSENYRDEFFKPFEQAGATEQNGTTNFDRTNFFQNVPTSALDMALWMESDRMGHLLGALDQRLLDEQRGVVQNEKRQGENQPYGKAFSNLVRNVFPEGHPYSWTPIGSMEDLNAATLDDVKDWFKTWYGPSNAVLVLAGDIDMATAKAKVEKYFAAIPGGEPTAKLSSWAPKLRESRVEVMADRVPQTRLMRAWPGPPANTADADALGLFMRTLAQGKTSRLSQRLVLKEQLASSVSGFNAGLEIADIYLLQVDLKPGVDVAKVNAVLDEELQRLRTSGPTEAELARTRTALQAQLVRGAERVGGFGGKSDLLAECATYTGKPDCFNDSLANISAATPKSIAQSAQNWLVDQHYTLVIEPFRKTEASSETVDRTLGVPKVESFPELKFPDLQTAKLSNGVEVVLAERNEVPLVQMRWIFPGGFSADQHPSIKRMGATSLMMGMLDEGSAGMSASQIAERAEELGAQLSFGNSLDFSSAGVSALKANLQESIALLAQVMLQPSFDSAELERVKAQTLAGIAQEKNNPNAIAFRVMPPLLYPSDHPYAIAFTGSGNEADVKVMTPELMRAVHAQLIRPEAAKLLVVGDIKLPDLMPMLEAAFGQWRADTALPTASIKPAISLQNKARVYLIDKPGAPQSTILTGQLIPGIAAPDRMVTDTALSIFGGTFSSRINMNLREDKRWSYGAFSFSQTALAERPLITSAGVQTDKTAESMQEIQRELLEFSSSKPPTLDEINKIKANDVRQLPGQFETGGAVLGALSEIKQFGYPDDYVRTLRQRTEAQSTADIQAAAAKYFNPKALTWVVIGDLSKIEAKVRALNLGEVQILDADGKMLTK